MARPRRFPVFRIGLTILAGSVLASLFYFYLGLGESMAKLNDETISTEPRDLLAYFTKNFLFAGSTAGILFYVGAALMVLGIIRNFSRASDESE